MSRWEAIQLAMRHGVVAQRRLVRLEAPALGRRSVHEAGGYRNQAAAERRWLRGDLPLLAPLAASPDLAFAALFVARLYRSVDGDRRPS